MSVSYRCIKYNDPDYPQKLRALPNAPSSLYVKGTLPDPEKPLAAIVGARSCSSYGIQSAKGFAKVLSSHGVGIISGLAFGIDTHAHTGCLEGGAPTYAVMGCGIDECYPRSNRAVYERILENGGGILSEYEPGTPALPHHFPSRNRIISALSDAVIVIEARVKSGSLITADYALEQSIPLYAVPGKISDPLSAGTNALIWQGAIPALSPENLLLDLGILPASKKEKSKTSPAYESLSKEERTLLACIPSEPVYFDVLCEKASFSLQKTASLLLSLELKGCVYQPVPGLYAAAYR